MLNHGRVWEQTSHDDEQHNSGQDPTLPRQCISHNRKAGSMLAQEKPREQAKEAHGIHRCGNGKEQSCERVRGKRSLNQ